jgi:hypothetical protein
MGLIDIDFLNLKTKHRISGLRLPLAVRLYGKYKYNFKKLKNLIFLVIFPLKNLIMGY